MPHSEMNITQKSRDENNDNKKRNNDTTINEKTTMLEVSQALIRPIKRDCFKYKYHLIFSSLIIIFFVVIILNITQIKIFFKEKNLEHNVVRNFSEIDSEPNIPTPMAGSESPIYWKNEKKINIQKVKREINSYIKDSEPVFNNKEDFIKRENPKISLIIPVYNKETFLHPLYKSIQSQSMKDIEIIFIDDNSNDDSVKIIEDFMRDDMRIILKKHDKNYRTFYSRNEGVKMAHGKYILFIDPDDLIVNNILEKSYETAEMYNLDIVQFYFLMGNFKVSELSTHFKYKSGILYQPQIKEIFYYGQTRNIWDKLIKREVLLKSESFMQEEFKNERYEVHDDDALFFGIIKSAESFGFLEQIGYFYNINIPDSTTKTKFNREKINKIFQALFTIMKYYYVQSEDNRKEKFLVGFKFFFNKVYVYQNYIKYMNHEFKIVLETLNLYINSPYILNSEKYFLQKFKAKVMDRLRQVIEES
jgi:glycosyltransferase involved in cell wall biosynthesis